MVCPNCQSETNGLKLNNRLYCTECGFLLTPPEEEKKVEPVEPPQIKEVRKRNFEDTPKSQPEAKIISGFSDDFAVAPLEAEEEVLDLVIDEAKKLEEEKKAKEKDVGSVKIPTMKKLPNTTRTIAKHNRPRTDLKKEGPFTLIPGEPDPIAEPEIEPASEEEEVAPNVKIPVTPIIEKVEEEPKDIEIDSPGDEVEILDETNEPTVPEKKEDSNKVNPPNLKNEMLLNYFRKVGNEPVREVKPKKKKKEFNWILLWGIVIPLILIISFVGLVLYVNLYAAKPDVAVRRAERQISFGYLHAGYLPPGYAVSYKTNATSASIEYVYEYLPDKTKTLSIKAEQTTLKPDDIRPKIITPTGKQFVNYSEDGRSLWYVGGDTIYFIEIGVLYTIRTNSDIKLAELIKVATALK